MNNPLLDRIIAWAKTDDNVIALITTGSYARGIEATDEYSDYDLEIIAKDPKKFAADDNWIHVLGNVWVSQYFDEGQPYPTRLVYFEDALKVDFTLADRNKIEEMALANKLDDLYERGYKALVDKEGIVSALPKASGSHPVHAKPTAQEFAATVSEFWFEAAHMPKYLAREDLWVVKLRDWTMKEMLLKMLEWHSLAKNGDEQDVWHIGSKMNKWVGGQTWGELQGVFGHFDKDDNWKSLMAVTKLFKRLTEETAAQLVIRYDASIETNIMAYIFEQEHKQANAR